MTANTYGRQNTAPVTNKSGGALAAGDVVIVDITNNEAVTTTTSAASTLIVGVVQSASIANNAVGLVTFNGYAPLINVNASVTRGHYGATHTVAKQAADAGASRGAGTFVHFWTGGTTPSGWVFNTDLLGSSLTNPMTTAEDIIKGGAAGAPARLAIGAAGGALVSLNSVLAYNSGTSMPGAKATGDRYWRTDLGQEVYWDGAQWLTTTEYRADFSPRDALDPWTTSPAPVGLTAVDTSQAGMWVTRLVCYAYVDTTNTGSAFWTFQLISQPVTGAVHNIGATFSTSADTASRFTSHPLAIGAAVTSGDTYLQVTATKTSTPGNLYWNGAVFYRLIIT